MHGSLLVFLVHTWLLAAPDEATTRPRKEDLDVVLRVADADFARYVGRCEAGAGPDREAERAYAHMAAMRVMAAASYPFARFKDGAALHNDEVHQAAQLYEKAYQCNPGQTQRHYLEAGIDVVAARQREILTVEGGSDTSADYRLLVADEQRLRAMLPGALTCVQQDATPCPSPRPCPDCTAAGVGRGYHGHWLGKLSLRAEVGGGFAVHLRDNASMSTQPSTFVVSLAPGVRFVAGRRQRHVVSLGFRYTLLQYAADAGSRSAHVMAARFEYGYHFVARWLSLHASFEPGIQAQSQDETFGHTHLGGSATLCTYDDALCLRIGGGASALPPGDGTALRFGTATFGIDILRLADNLLRAGKAK